MIEIVPMEVHHIYELGRNLREKDRIEVEALGKTPQQALRQTYYESLEKKTLLINGKAAASFGFIAAILGPIARPWLLTAPEVEKVYMLLASSYRKEVKNMLRMYPKLENYCLADYTQSLDVLRMVGFTVHPPEPYGPKGVNFCKFTMES